MTFLPLLCTIRNERKPPRRRGAVSTPCSNEICACDGNGSYVRFRCCLLWRFNMGFMQAYKRLDALCRDINGIGVTGYIEDMEHTANGNLSVPGWNADYQKLKYYRHIRNQIAHEVNATEEQMCSLEDVAWIEEFHQRILKQTDPLAIQYSISQLREKREVSTKQSAKTRTHPLDPPSTYAQRDSAPSYVAGIIVGIIFFVLLFVLLLIA